MNKNKKLIIGGIAILSMTAIIAGQTNAASNMLKNGTRNNMKIERMNKGLHMGSGFHTGLHLGSGNRPEFESGDKKHFGSGFHFGSGENGRSGNKEHFGSGNKEYFGTETYSNSEIKTKINTTKIAKKNNKKK